MSVRVSPLVSGIQGLIDKEAIWYPSESRRDKDAGSASGTQIPSSENTDQTVTEDGAHEEAILYGAGAEMIYGSSAAEVPFRRWRR